MSHCDNETPINYFFSLRMLCNDGSFLTVTKELYDLAQETNSNALGQITIDNIHVHYVISQSRSSSETIHHTIFRTPQKNSFLIEFVSSILLCFLCIVRILSSLPEHQSKASLSISLFFHNLLLTV